MTNVESIFGIDVFNEQVMKERLDKDTYCALKATIKNGESLDLALANSVAKAMKEWALEKGCTHYTHWFQPMTGITAEKHDSFLTPTDNGKIIMDFSGKELIKGESDASSFPNGGIRATFEARGYTAWDPTSYAFVKDQSLYIPTAFMSYTGEVLDKKTPLLRSMDAISNASVRILKLFGKDDVTRVTANVGAEQEYFLIDRKMYDRRKDLKYTGRTLFGARATKGQELEDHYFGAIKNRVSAYMKELDEQLWRLGIYSKTKHNEVAPAQHELAPVFTTTNIATDQNQLTMETMKTIARKHGMSCLLHEKPFAEINGSGKHNNWSLSTNTGENLLKPGKKPEENTQFLLFLAAVIKAVDEHQDLLRISVATAGNDHRLGANEAPPAIISMYLGDDLEAIVDAIVNNEEYESHGRVLLHTGVESMPDFKKDNSDRNRTSPFAFTGNKFEFRSLGSSISISCPNIMLNTIVADALSQFADKLERADDFESACRRLIKHTFRNHKRIIFNGDGYTDEWVQEAERRGLLNLKNTPDALKHFTDKKNIELFIRNHIYGEKEVNARYEILLSNYSKVIAIEAQTMINMAKKDIFPAVSKFTGELAQTILSKRSVGADITVDAETKLLKNMSTLLSEFATLTDKLEHNLVGAQNHKNDPQKLAEYYRDNVLSVMNKLRSVGDNMETDMSTEHWPYPSYGDMLYSVQ